MTSSDTARLLSERGSTLCRGCGRRTVESVLDLGDQPLANGLLHSTHEPDSAYPLHLRICTSCGLGQVGEVVLPERIFSDYPYLSSVSTSWVEHARRYAAQVTGELGLDPTSLVVEVASNDGYLLKEFQALGIGVLGVEPAGNVAGIATAAGVPTLNAFFGRDTARAVVEEHGHPRLVAANNVMAHVPDLDDFVGGFAILCASDTVITVENPSFATLLSETQFDTIYHEHYSYLSVHAVAAMVAPHGLELFRVERLKSHGGSYRYWIAPQGSRPLDPSVAEAVADELAAGLLDRTERTAFADRSRRTISGLRAWFDERRAAGATVVGYGAAAKGNTLLNAAGATADDLVAVADANTTKQGSFLPGSRVPIVSPEALSAAAPTDVLLLPWNLRTEVVPLLADIVPAATVWIAVPTMTRVSG